MSKPVLFVRLKYHFITRTLESRVFYLNWRWLGKYLIMSIAIREEIQACRCAPAALIRVAVAGRVRGVTLSLAL